jgi:two-component system cell cycle response regulator
VTDEWDEETGATDIEELQRSGSSARRACLTVLTGTLSGQLFKITKGNVNIGRSPQAELRLDDDGISRNHARIRHEASKLWVEDLESRNGTFLNGERLKQPVELRDGDKIQVGRGTVLRFGFQDALDESFHENLLSSALRDGLTKLFNKRYLMDRLDSELKFAVRHETALSFLLIDIDQFKKVNDTYGHLAGDAVLTSCAQVLGRAVRNEDVVARFGGDEFAIILRAIGIEPAFQMAERLRKLVEASTASMASSASFGGAASSGAGALHATVSIGVAGFPSSPVHTPDRLVEAADQALYRAKADGRNRVRRA